MMTKRFSRLLQPGTALILALAIAGSNLGLAYGLDARFKELRRDYKVGAEDWQRFAGEVWTMQWDIALTVAALVALGIILAPEPARSDRRALRELARRKLAESVLTESEMQQWSAILEEVDDV